MLLRVCPWIPGTALCSPRRQCAGAALSDPACVTLSQPGLCPRACRKAGQAATGSPPGAQARYFMAAPSVAGSGSLNEMALLGQSSMQTEQWMHSSG